MDAFAHYEKIDVDEDELPEVEADEVALHNTPVYDVTDWQHEHPGGDFILQEYAGQDASDMFRDVQHSRDAMDIRSNFIIARLKRKAKL